MQNTGKAEVVKQSFIFSKLSDDELAELANLATERSFTAGEFIFWEGDAQNVEAISTIAWNLKANICIAFNAGTRVMPDSQ